MRAAKYGDPRTAEYIVATLLARQDKLARWAFSRLSPLDQFTVEVEPVEGGAVRVCFDDLWAKYGLGDGSVSQ